MGRGDGGSNRVNRGGSWNNPAANLRAANRNRDTPGNRNDNLGFRCLSSTHRPTGGGHGSRPCAKGVDHAPRPCAAGLRRTKSKRRSGRRPSGGAGRVGLPGVTSPPRR